MRYVTNMGGLWKVTDSRWRAWLNEVLRVWPEDGPEMPGVYLGSTIDVTDMGLSQAEALRAREETA